MSITIEHIKSFFYFCSSEIIAENLLFLNPLINRYSLFLSLSASPVTDVELKRLKDAFKRTSGLSFYMTQQCFYREVLGDGVPPKVAEVSHCAITYLLNCIMKWCTVYNNMLNDFQVATKLGLVEHSVLRCRWPSHEGGQRGYLIK